MWDGYEVQYPTALYPCNGPGADNYVDYDADGLFNIDEFLLTTNADLWPTTNFMYNWPTQSSDPTNMDSDNDLMPDRFEYDRIAGCQCKGHSAAAEYAGKIPGTDHRDNPHGTADGQG